MRSTREGRWDPTTLAMGAIAGVSMAFMTTWLAERRRQQQQGPQAWPTNANRSLATSTRSKTTLVGPVTLPDEIRQEQLSRHALYFGQEGLAKVQQASLVVVGVGGVGSHAAHMLARAGVGHLRIIDFDQVTLSSLNRHACATLADVGLSKVACLQSFCQAICPDPRHLKMEAIPEMYNKDTGERLLQHSSAGQEWDLIIDCIDDVPTKARLIADALRRGVRVLSCMGAGGKSDVTRLHVSDLRTASRDPLASKLRQALKKEMSRINDSDGMDNSTKKPPSKRGPHSMLTIEESNNEEEEEETEGEKKDDAALSYLDDMHRLAVIYSSEKTQVKLAEFTEDQLSSDGGVSQYGAVEGMRIRIVPVLGTMPAIMGQSLAAVALQTLALGPASLQPVTGERVSKNVRNKLFQRLKTREDKYAKRIIKQNIPTLRGQERQQLDEAGGMRVGNVWIGPLQIDQDDVEYMLEVWHNRCAVTGARLGTVLELTRWDKSQPGTCDNLVLLSSHALQAFEQTGPAGLAASIQQRIEARLATCRVDSQAEQTIPN